MTSELQQYVFFPVLKRALCQHFSGTLEIHSVQSCAVSCTSNVRMQITGGNTEQQQQQRLNLLLAVAIRPEWIHEV